MALDPKDSSSLAWIARSLDRLVKQEDECERLKAALPPPDNLEQLANWIDQLFPDDPHPEIQKDLRRWAAGIREVLDA